MFLNSKKTTNVITHNEHHHDFLFENANKRLRVILGNGHAKTFESSIKK